MAKVPPGITQRDADKRYARTIVSDAQGARTWIRQGAGVFTLASVNFTPDDVPIGSTIRVSGVLQYYAPPIASKGLYITIGGVSIGELSGGISATTQRVSFLFDAYVKSTGVSVLRAQAQMGQGSASTTDGTGSFFGTNTGGGPTATTINMLAPQTLAVKTNVGGSLSSSGEWHELHGFTVEVFSPGADSHGFATSTSIACWGDSLTIGSGAVLYTSDYPSVVAKNHPGTPLYNGGVGGEKSGQILTRQLADKIRGRHWTCVLWMGRNNTTDAGFAATVLADIAAAVANLSHSRFVVMTVLNSTAEDNTTQKYADIIALNNAILAAYPTNSIDIRGILATEANGTIPAGLMSDVIHLNASGYAIVAATVDAYLVAKGWM